MTLEVIQEHLQCHKMSVPKSTVRSGKCVIISELADRALSGQNQESEHLNQ